MNKILRADLGTPALLEFSGPDVVRFLNGQVTQDVRRLAGGKIALPSCVTDAKGKLQFRVTITAVDGGKLWVTGPVGTEEALAARLTRYLIADDVEFTDLTGAWRLWHFTGFPPDPPQGVIVREANRYGVPGVDWWVPADIEVPVDATDATDATDDAETLEASRIVHGVPAWGRELVEGMLPPEAALEESDISYQKGCYIGQEVISRIKSAGKVNKRLARFSCAAAVPLACGPLEDAEGKPGGEVTSISPVTEGGVRRALGFVRRGAEEWFFRAPDGTRSAIECV